MFDLDDLERRCGLTARELAALRQDVRAELPHDDLLYELHLMRALNKIVRDRTQGADASRSC